MGTMLNMRHVEGPELSLKECLDQIWQWSTSRLHVARSCQSELSRTAPMQAIAFDLASFFETVPQRVGVSLAEITLGDAAAARGTARGRRPGRRRARTLRAAHRGDGPAERSVCIWSARCTGATSTRSWPMPLACACRATKKAAAWRSSKRWCPHKLPVIISGGCQFPGAAEVGAGEVLPWMRGRSHRRWSARLLFRRRTNGLRRGGG